MFSSASVLSEAVVEAFSTSGPGLDDDAEISPGLGASCRLSVVESICVTLVVGSMICTKLGVTVTR